MRKIKISDSEIRLLLVLLSVMMLVGAYFLSYVRNMELARGLEARNEEDRAYIETLEAMIGRRAEVEAQTAQYRQAIEDIIAKYPTELPTEKAIAIIYDMESRTGAKVDNITFSMDNLVVSMSGDAGTEYVAEEYAEEEYLEGEYLEEGYLEEEYPEEEYVEDTQGGAALAGTSSVGYSDTLSMSYEAEYSAFKRMIAYIEGLPDRTTIPAITAAYDSMTGNISGSITLNMYYLTNTEREYEVPVIPGGKGVPDIFRSGSGTAATMTGPAVEESEEEDGGEQENEEEDEEEQGDVG